MQQVQSILDAAMTYIQSSFQLVNAWQGLLVALVAVFFLKKWRQLLVVTLVAALAYVLVEHFWPIVMGGARVRLPDVTKVPFWSRLGAVYVGELLVIGIFFAVKSAIQTARGSSAPPPSKKK